jgi:rod shape determining protein RodA
VIEAVARQRVRVAGRRADSRLLAFLKRLDWVLMAAAFALVGYGLWVVSGITRFDVPGDQQYYVVRQAIAGVLGVAALAAAAIVPIDLARRHWRLLYCATLALMILVFLVAETIRGSKRWIDLGVIQFQPSELGKVLFVLAIAGFLVGRQGRVNRWRTIVQAIGLGTVPILLVFLQPDLGTALVYGAALVAVLFFVGVRWRQLLVFLVAVAFVGLSIIWLLPTAGVEVLKPYQSERVAGFLDPDRDPSGLTWNVNQSMTAVGAGGLTASSRRARPASTTCPSTRPTSRSPHSPSSVASSAPRSCCCSTCSSSGAVCASSPWRAISTVPSSRAASSSRSSSRCSSTSA